MQRRHRQKKQEYSTCMNTGRTIGTMLRHRKQTSRAEGRRHPTSHSAEDRQPPTRSSRERHIYIVYEWFQYTVRIALAGSRHSRK
jgi:hypothetical protein